MWTWKKPIPGHRYSVGCLPEGEIVLTDSGIKKIEEVTFNDLLINKDGKKTKIINKQITNNFNDYTYSIKIEGVLRRTKFTGIHPIFSSMNTKLCRKHGEKRYWRFDFKFNKAEDLKEKDWLIFPNMYAENTLNNEEILSNWINDDSIRYDFKISNPLLDEEFWWYIGLWLAEGRTQERIFNEGKNVSRTIVTAHNLKTEMKYFERIEKLFNKYGRKVCNRKKEESSSIEAVFSCVELFYFLTCLCFNIISMIICSKNRFIIMKLTRRQFVQSSLLAGAGLMLAPAKSNSDGTKSSFFGIHPFILQYPDSVFIMKTNVDKKSRFGALTRWPDIRNGLLLKSFILAKLFVSAINFKISACKTMAF